MVTKLINSKLSVSTIRRLNFLAWNHCQESCFNSEIAVDGWDCLKGSKHRVSNVVCKVEKHLAVSPSCWKPVCSDKSMDTTALLLTFSHVNALCHFISFLCILQLFFFFFFFAKRNVMGARISSSERCTLYYPAYICSSVQQILFIS